MLMAELFLEGWGGGTVQSALTWLAANLADLIELYGIKKTSEKKNDLALNML